jgi:DNA-binding XRE family transcriptional regulator
VKAARLNAGLTQQELALVAGVSTRTVYAIEHEKPTARLDALVAVLSAVGLKLGIVERAGPVWS